MHFNLGSRCKTCVAVIEGVLHCQMRFLRRLDLMAVAFTDLILTGMYIGPRPAPWCNRSHFRCRACACSPTKTSCSFMWLHRFKVHCSAPLSVVFGSISCSQFPLWWKQDMLSKPSLILGATQRGFRKRSPVPGRALRGPPFRHMFVPCTSSVFSNSPQPPGVLPQTAPPIKNKNQSYSVLDSSIFL